MHGAQALERIHGLRAEHFSDELRRRVFQTALDRMEDDGVIDTVTVGERLSEAEYAYITSLSMNPPALDNLRLHAEMVRKSYERRELATALSDFAERAKAPGADFGALRRDVERRLDTIRAPKDSDSFPAPLDLAALAEREPTRPEHIVADWLPAGEVTLLSGHGGAGKSAIALHLAVCIALGVPWYGMATERRRVLYMSAEDSGDVLHWRLARIAAYLRVPLSDLAGWLEILDASQVEAELMVENAHAEPTFTVHYTALRKRIVDPSAVLILDGASDLYGANENARRHVRRFVRGVRRLIGRHGAAVILAHVDKAAARRTADSSASNRYSGSTAWHNSMRARWELDSSDDGALRLTLAKSNHAKRGAEIALRWDEQAHMHVAMPEAAGGGIVREIRDRNEREAILAALRACESKGITVPAATTGNRTAHHVLAAQDAFPDALRAKADRGRFWAHIERLRAMGAVHEVEKRGKDRHSARYLQVAAPEQQAC